MAQAAEKIQTNGEWLSESEIAKRCKLHRQTVVSRLEDLGREPDEERSTAKCKVHWFDDELQFAILNAKDKYAAVKYRDTKAAAELKELKLAEARKDLVPAAEMVDVVQRVASSLYIEYTQRMPKRVGNKLAKAKNAAAVKTILKADSDRIMKSLRENFEAFFAQK